MSRNTSGNNNISSPDAHMRAEPSASVVATTTATATTIATTSSGSRQSSPNIITDVVDAATPSNKNNNDNNNSRRGSQKENSPSQPGPEVRHGKCKWFNVAKGWGFITPNDGGVEVFVHQSVIQMNGFRSLAEQEDVEFESEVTPRGVEATRVAGREGFDCVGSNFRPRLHGNRFVRRVRCYNCNKFNHIAADCRLEPQPRRCYLCQQEDHLIADCPRNTTQASADNSGGSVVPPAEGDLSST